MCCYLEDFVDFGIEKFDILMIGFNEVNVNGSWFLRLNRSIKLVMIREGDS